MTNTSVLPSIFLGLVSIIVPIIVSDNVDFSSIGLEKESFSFWCLGLLVILTLFFIVALSGGRFFFTKQPPKVYAEYSISGTSPSHSFTYISYCVWKECLFFESHREIFKKFEILEQLEGNPEQCEIGLSLLPKIYEFQKKFHDRFHKIKKIDFMMFFLSESMNVPGYRLSDFLFQFSPDIYLYESRLMFERMIETVQLVAKEKELIRKKIKEGAIDKEDRNINISNKAVHVRNRESSKKIRELNEALKKRKGFQESLVLYKDLHESIIDMSKDFGLSSSLSAYCFGLQKNLPKLEGEKGDDNLWEAIIRKVLFLYHKRRIYPGFDLHAVLSNFILGTDSGSTDESDIDFYRALRSFPKNNLGFLISKLQDGGKSIISSLEEHKTDQRGRISKRFIEYVRKIAGDNKDKKSIVFITKGFSSVVNNSLYTLAENIKNNQKNWGEITGGNMEFYYFILHTPSINEEARTTTRYIRYRFKENPDIQRDAGNLINVKNGDIHWWKSSFDNTDSLNIMVSGAEFIQFRKDQSGNLENRLINDEGVIDFFDSSSKRWIDTNDKIKHIVLAEDYKIFPKSMDDTIFRNAFNRDYSENQRLFEWSSNRKIISGHEDANYSGINSCNKFIQNEV